MSVGVERGKSWSSIETIVSESKSRVIELETKIAEADAKASRSLEFARKLMVDAADGLRDDSTLIERELGKEDGKT